MFVLWFSSLIKPLLILSVLLFASSTMLPISKLSTYFASVKSMSRSFRLFRPSSISLVLLSTLSAISIIICSSTISTFTMSVLRLFYLSMSIVLMSSHIYVLTYISLCFFSLIIYLFVILLYISIESIFENKSNKST